MIGVFLCGGVGKRMLPLTEEKFLLKFLGKTLLQRQLEMAKSAGIKDFVVVAGEHSIGRVKNILGDSVEYAVQKKPNGMAGALQSARPLVEGREIIVINPNDVIGKEAYEGMLRNTGRAAILGRTVREYFPGGYIVSEDGILRSIVEKPSPGNEPSDMVNIVVHAHPDTKRLFALLDGAQGGGDDIYEKALDEMAKLGTVDVVRYSGDWIPIKYPWHVLNAMNYFFSAMKTGIANSARISEKASVEGNVIIEENARILENAIIRGPCYIGKNTVVGNGALVRNAHIGENCVVGYGTEIKNSYIGNNCWFHSNYIGDSIIDDNCSFGAGTVTANLRFDKKIVKVKVRDGTVSTGMEKLGAIIGSGSKTGINASIMPGVRIGPDSFVGPNVNLVCDLGPGKMILMEPAYKISDNKMQANGKIGMMRKLGI